MTLNRDEKKLLEDFSRHPGWDILNKLHIQQRQEKLGEFARRLFTLGPTDEIDQKELIYWRGFFRGQRFLLNNPKLEASQLKAEKPHQEDDLV